MSFPTTTMQQWNEKVSNELKGADPSSIHRKQLSGIVTKTLYTLEDRPNNFGVHRSNEGWKRRQRVAHASVIDCNKQILEDLAGGIEELWIHFQNVFVSSQDGVLLQESQQWTTLLEGVHTDLIRIQISAEDLGLLIPVIKQDLESQAATLHLDWQWDPLADMAKYGICYQDMIKKTLEHVNWAQTCSASWRPLCINLTDYHLAGATAVHELAFMLATLAEYQRWFTDKDLVSLGQLCWVQFSVGRNIFENVAKLRAARRLWAGFGRACGVEDLPCSLNAVTSERMICYFDQWVNMLRETTACAASIWGGADSVTNLPHDHLHLEKTPLGSRFARNLHSVLDEECHLGHISDPLGGSYYVENLTETMCQQAWMMFQEIEKQGGLAAMISSEAIFSELNACLADRQSLIERRIMPITGLTEFANPEDATAEEQEIGRLMSTALTEAQIRQIQVLEEENLPVESMFSALNRVRDAGWIETTRASLPKNDEFPETVFLANLGPESNWKPRATFARNFFAIMGWGVQEYKGLAGKDQLDDLINAFLESGGRVACICGRKSDYNVYLEDVANALRDCGAYTLVAGENKDGFVEQDIFLGKNIREAWVGILNAVYGGEG